MPQKLKWNAVGAKWNSGLRWNQVRPDMGDDLSGQHQHSTQGQTSMEYWEVTKERAQISRPIWQTYTPTVKIGTLGYADLDTMIAGYEPLVQQRTTAQDDFDEGERVVARSLLVMKILSVKVPAIIEAQLSENDSIMKDVDDMHAINPKTEPTILKRARMVHPVWVRANTALAALTPSQPPVTRVIAGTAYTAALFKGQLDGFNNLDKAMRDLETVLNVKRAALRTHDRAVDQLIKRWYKNAKALAEPDSDLETALEGVPTEEGTPAPDTIEITTVTQGGDGGLQVLVSYVPGGGEHATTKLVKWQVGSETDFPHSAPLDPSGNALGPFTEGAVVKIITQVSNNAGTRTIAPRTITIEAPI
jgi:hypothetical protein